ncbi:LLM class flavin-dependent oxidoreductase [Staphylococcus warneri]|uniref:LLM class flavin-dependent oxidoreductase n=1 Tax=Staphylococcus warneri TaxID=1292 RepID=UPI0032613976
MIKKLSILDMSFVDDGKSAKESVLNTVELAKEADQLGYDRFWVTEHHNLPNVAGASPAILIGQIAAVTKNIRVGSGGVMLPNHSPLIVAENFKLLETFYPNRIDLGLGRAPGTSGVTALAIRRATNTLNSDDFRNLLHELQDYGDENSHHSLNQFSNITAMPKDAQLPTIWSLGSSEFSAKLAAEEGLKYSFAYHFNHKNAKQIIQLYRDEFEAIHGKQAPGILLGVSVITGETTEEVMLQKKLLSVKYLKTIGAISQAYLPDLNSVREVELPENLVRMANEYMESQIIGTWNEVKEQLDRIAEDLQVEEVIITSTQLGFNSRVKFYQKLSKNYKLNEK